MKLYEGLIVNHYGTPMRVGHIDFCSARLDPLRRTKREIVDRTAEEQGIVKRGVIMETGRSIHISPTCESLEEWKGPIE